jgi:crotonobetainyl-CoA:carnitine CoA-transferase CaiB-like acyl-CoA transferase
MVNMVAFMPWKASSTMIVNGRVDRKHSPNPDNKSMRNPPTCTIQWSTNSAEKKYLYYWWNQNQLIIHRHNFTMYNTYRVDRYSWIILLLCISLSWHKLCKYSYAPEWSECVMVSQRHHRVAPQPIGFEFL